MTYREALELLWKTHGKFSYQDRVDAYHLLDELSCRAMSKFTVYVKNEHMFMCPNCKSWISPCILSDVHFCPLCGQALDWEGDQEEDDA